MKKKLSVLLAVLCACALCLSLTACGEKPAEAKPTAFVSVDINPSLELTLDQNNKVLSVVGANEDGQVLLYGEADLVGLSVEDAVEKITALAVDLGYLDADNATVQTSVTAPNAASILQNVQAKITAAAASKNVTVECTDTQAYSVLRRLQAVQAQYPDNAAVQALTPERFKLVLSATETGEVTLEAAVTMDTEALVSMVSEAHKTVEVYATDAYNRAKADAESVFAKAEGVALDGIYTALYVKNHPASLYNALAYQGFRSAARGMDALADVILYAQKAIDTPITDQTQIAAVAAALGVTADELRNTDDDVTVRSIEAYADKAFKNSQAGADLEARKQALTQALTQTEAAVQAEIDRLSQAYQTEIEAMQETFDDIAARIDTVAALVPESVKTQINAMVADFTSLSQAMTDVVSDGKVTVDEVRGLAKTLQEKSDAALSKIEAELTSEEKEQIAATQKQASETLANAKAKFEQAVEKAKTDAETRLAALKADRRQK